MKKLKPLSLIVKQSREDSGLSQQALADAMGVHRSVIAKIEGQADDGKNPSLNVLLALEAVLGAKLFSGALEPHVKARRRELKNAAIGDKPASRKKKAAATG